MDDCPRLYGLALSHFLVNNPEIALTDSQLGAILYRIRVVDNYGVSDVHLVCNAIKNIIRRLVQLGPISYSSEIWMAIFMAVAESSIDPEWKVMAEEIDVMPLAEPFLKCVDETTAARQILKASEQMNSLCETYILEYGLIRRVFAGLWDMDLTETTKDVCSENWENISALCDETSSTSALKVMTMKVFELFQTMKDRKIIATEIYFCSIARMIIYISNTERESNNDDSNTDTPFKVFEKLLSRIWIDLCDEPEIRKYTLIAFNKLLIKGLETFSELKAIKAFEDTCVWLKFSYKEICENMEDTLWNCCISQLGNLLSYKPADIGEPDDIDYDDENWMKEMCEKIPKRMDNEEKAKREKIEKTREALNFILEILMCSTNRQETLDIMANKFTELIENREIEIAARVKNVYKSFIDRGIISEQDQLELAKEMIENSIQEIKSMFSCTPECSSVRKEIANLFFQKLIVLMKDENDIDTTKKKLADAEAGKSFLVRYMSQEATIEIIKALVDVILNTKNHIGFAINLFCVIVETCSPTEFSHRDDIGWYLDFESIGIEKDVWDRVFTKLAEADSEECEKKVYTGLTVLSILQLSTTNLSFNELMYVFRRLGYQMTENGQKCLRLFYKDSQEINDAIKVFTSHHHVIDLAVQLMAQLSVKVMLGDSWKAHAHSLELVLTWLDEFKIMEEDEVVTALVDLENKIATFNFMDDFLGVPSDSIDLESVYSFARIYKSDLFQHISASECDRLEKQLKFKLDECHERSPSEETNTKRSLGSLAVLRMKDMLPSLKKKTKEDVQLITFFKDVATRLLIVLKSKEKADNDVEISGTDLFSWATGVSCGNGNYPKELIEEAQRVLRQKFGNEPLEKAQRYHVTYYLMMGLTLKSSPEVVPLNTYFANKYIYLLKNDLKNLTVQQITEDLDNYMGKLSYWLAECSKEKPTVILPECFMSNLGNLIMDYKAFHEKSYRAVFLEKFAAIFLQRIGDLAIWIGNSDCPVKFFASMKSILQSVFNHYFSEKYENYAQMAFEKAVDIMFNEKTAENLMGSALYSIQMTDKRYFSSLNLKSHSTEYDGNGYIKNELFILREAMEILADYGDVRVHRKMIKKLIEMLPDFSHSIAKHSSILNGTRKVMDDKHLIFNVMLLTELMEYSVRIARTIYPTDISAEEKFDQLFMFASDDSVRRNGSNDIKNQKKSDEASMETNEVYCTYMKTGENFVTQHWYNCYTCNMYDQHGICSVCVVNCHRGHDVTYSKKGSFFCDCGAKRCISMERVEHVPNVDNAIKGQLPNEKGSGTRKVKLISSYELRRTRTFDDRDRDALVNDLKELNKQLAKCQKDFETILESIRNGCDNGMDVAKKRQAVLDSFKGNSIQDVEEVWDTQFITSVDGKLPEIASVIPSRRGEIERVVPIQHMPGVATTAQSNTPYTKKDMADVVKLEDGTEILVVVPENVLAALQFYYIDSKCSLINGLATARMETENLPFIPKKLSVSGNRVAVCGVADVFAMRLSPKGDVLDRAHLKLSETPAPSSSFNNPVVKTIWCSEPHRQILTVATVQFVRVYDLTLDTNKFVEEMVLPVGNVEDVVMITRPDGRNTLLILSTTGYLYEHQITTTTAENNSYFLTNVINMPAIGQGGNNSLGSGCSLYYSSTYELLFISLERGTYYARLPDIPFNPNPAAQEITYTYIWKRLITISPVHSWKEAAGVISCLAIASTVIFYFYPTVGKVLCQKMHVTRTIMTQFLMRSSRNETIYSLLLYPDYPTIEIHKTTWKNVPDLWIDDEPTELVVVEIVDSNSQPEPVDKEDLVLMNEECPVIENVEWFSRDVSMYYERNDLNKRLKADNIMHVFIPEPKKLVFRAKLPSTGFVVRGIRVETPGNLGPASLKIGQLKFPIEATRSRVVDIRLTRDQSLGLRFRDHRDLQMEFAPQPNATGICIKSLRIIGCSREMMEEVQPRCHNLPVLTLPHRFVSSFFDLSSSLLAMEQLKEDRKTWLKKVVSRHAVKLINHPTVYDSAVRLLKGLCQNDVQGFFQMLDSINMGEWKFLRVWKPERGMVLMRQKYIEYLLKRLETNMTRWDLFENLLKTNFGSILEFVKLLRDEMIAMPLSKAQIVAQAMTRIVFGFLAEYSDESDDLIDFFLDMFTDDKSYHLTNDLRTAVQFATCRYMHIDRDDRAKAQNLVEQGYADKAVVAKRTGTMAFYGKSRIYMRAHYKELDDLLKMTGGMKVEELLEKNDKSYDWLDKIVEKTIDKLVKEGDKNSMPNPLVSMSDTPAFGLTMVIAYIMTQFQTRKTEELVFKIVNAINFEVEHVVHLNESNFRNFALLRVLQICISRWLNTSDRKDSQSSEDESGSKENVEEEKMQMGEILEKIGKSLEEKNIMELCFEMMNRTATYMRTWHRPRAQRKHRKEPNRRIWLPHVQMIAASANAPRSLNYTEVGAKTEIEAFYVGLSDLSLKYPTDLHRIYSIKFEEKWFKRLCELATLSDVPGSKLSKKLLYYICDGDKVKCRAMREKFRMQESLEFVLRKYATVQAHGGGHQQLTEIVDYLTPLITLATARPDMWRDVVDIHIASMLRLACITADAIASLVIDLLIIAIRDSSAAGSESISFVDRIIEADGGALLKKIVIRFLIGKDENMRWTVHGLLRSIIQLASRQNQTNVVRQLYLEIYPDSRNIGKYSAQLVDLVCTYAPRLFNSIELMQMCEAEIEYVKEVAERFEKEGYEGDYRKMMEIGLGWKAMLFDENPCLVCYNRKETNDVMKLSSIKSDVRYSTNAMMYKLNNHYEISRVAIKLSEVKKTKLIRKVSIYYCAKSVEGVVELKLSPELWRKCGQAIVSQTDTVINVALAVPIITSSLIIEFTEMHDVVSASGQLHCPRCSVVVRSHSGVCENCGENAYQCIKCRSINYVEREPYLCQTCGFCKYARMDVLLTGRQLPGTQHITCDQERTQSLEELSKLLTKLENQRSKLMGLKAFCEALYFRNRPLAPFNVHAETKETQEYFSNQTAIQMPPLDYQSTVSLLNKVSQSLVIVHESICLSTEQLIALREELRKYDENTGAPPIFYTNQMNGFYSTCANCFGCLCASLIHSIALLHAVCEDETSIHQLMTTSDLYDVLGPLGNKYAPLKEECENLFVRMTLDNPEATKKVAKMIERGKVDLTVFVKSLLQTTDSSWEIKLKILMQHTLSNPDEINCLHTLTVLNRFMQAALPIRMTIEEKIVKRKKKGYKKVQRKMPSNPLIPVKNETLVSREKVIEWLTSSDDWDACCASTSAEVPKNSEYKFDNAHLQWIVQCIFSPWMSVRASANKLLWNISAQPGHEGIAVRLMAEWLDKMVSVPVEFCDQFMQTAHSIVSSSSAVKTRLFLENFHIWLIKRIRAECVSLYEDELKASMMNHSSGVKMRCYSELLCLLFTGSEVDDVLLNSGADELLGFLLQSTIFLKRLIARRTRPIDAARTVLEKLLRRVSAKDSTKLMEACVDSLKVMTDTKTLAHVVAVLLEVMDPEKEGEEVFFMQIEKDAQQEDFLQGRMTGNPYKSIDNGLGPLMRDIKNKICRDTEMIALMEDDNGMELLVNNSIVSLALPVRQVYEKLWRRHHPGTPMVIVYRMRGLMGDAIESFISSFGDVIEGEEEEDEGLTYVTRSLINCGGMKRLLELLRTSKLDSSGRFLLSQLRRIFERIVKSSAGRHALVSEKTIPIMINVVRQCCENSNDDSKLALGMEFYKVIEVLVSDVNIHPILTGISEDDTKWLINQYDLVLPDGTVSRFDPNTETIRKSMLMMETMSANAGNIVLGSDVSENILVDRYRRVMRFEYVDKPELHRTITEKEDAIWMAEQLTVTTASILASARGTQLKQKILDSGVVAETCKYLITNHPPLYSTTESQDWKNFLSRSSLKLMLNFLHGMARGHPESQKAIAQTSLPLLHRMEQIASENSIGTLAENVMDALNENKEVAEKIIAVRQETKMKKRQMAMAMRSKQLSKMGMQVGKGGEVKVSSRQITNEPALDEESEEFVCCICRESALTGTKVAAVYAFAALVDNSDRSEMIGDLNLQRVSSVSRMVMVHMDCHSSAIRRAGGGRTVDEWSKAMLHNAGARCNILTPIATGQSSPEAWRAAMSRYLGDYEKVRTILRGITRHFIFLDMCKCVDRFVNKQSFSTQSFGGGRESNMQYLGILHLLGLTLPEDESSDLVTSTPHHRIVSFLFTELTVADWNESKVDYLRAVLNETVMSGVESSWQGLRPALLTWAWIDLYFNKVIPIDSEDRLQWLRTNLKQTMRNTADMVLRFDEIHMKCTGVDAYCQATELNRNELLSFFEPAEIAPGAQQPQEQAPE